MLNIALNIEECQYRALHSDFESGAEYRPGEPNIELYIQMFYLVLNIDLDSRI